MSFYKAYLSRLVGGFKNTPIRSIKPGQIVTFTYTPSDDTKTTKRKLMRIVFVLNTFRDSRGLKLHGINLEILPWGEFKSFLKIVLVTDTISLLKRRYELISPVKEIVNRPRSFYATNVKRILSTRDCYRTYITSNMKTTKLAYLDFSKIYTGKTEPKKTLISKDDKLSELIRERKLVESAIGTKLDNLSDTKFKNIVIDRFGDVDTFLSVFREVENFVKETDVTSSTEPPVDEK